jgi:hypothetical protein
MEHIQRAKTERTPEIDFNFSENTFSLRGESYPEDVKAFFGPIMDPLKNHLTTQKDTSITFDFELIYFNSSTAKVLMTLMDLLDETALRDNNVVINWYFDEEDDNMEEMGAEFAEDLANITFNMKPQAGS